MKRYCYKGKGYTIKELSELSGIEPHTLRDRLRRGYPIEQAMRPTPVLESVEHFCEASYFKDWIGLSISDLHEIYWKWCIQHGYVATTKQGFSRQLKTIYPQLHTVPTANASGNKRIIRRI